MKNITKKINNKTENILNLFSQKKYLSMLVFVFAILFVFSTPKVFAYTISSYAQTGTYPDEIITDSSANIYTANLNGDSVTKVDSFGSPTTYALNPGSQPMGLAVDSSSNVFVANSGLDTISKIASDGTVTATFATLPTGSHPMSITVDTNNNLYVADYLLDTVSKITPAGSVSLFATLPTGSNPISIIFNIVDGNLYTANYTSNTVSQIILSNGTVNLLGTTGNAPRRIRIDSGNIYTSNNSVPNSVTKITLAGVVTNFPTTTSSLYGGGVAIDALGNMFVANNDGVTKITPLGVVTNIGGIGYYPYDITLNPDVSGGLLVANAGGHSISKVINPTISNAIPVSTPTYDTTPDYTFFANNSGTITYGGSCSSATTVAVGGNNTVTFNTLSAGTYSNCTVMVTDDFGQSNILSVPSFTIVVSTITAAQTGLWSSTSTWVGGVVPGQYDNVVIPSGKVVHVDTSNATALSVVINNAGATTGIIIDGGNILVVYGGITLNAPSSVGTTTLNVGDGIIQATGLSIAGGAANLISQVTINAGTLDIHGNISFSGQAAQAKISFTSVGAVFINGNFGNGGTFTQGTGQVAFQGGGTQTIGAYSFYNLIVSNASQVALNGNVTAHYLGLYWGTLDVGNYTLTVSGNTNIANNGASILKSTGSGTMNMGPVEITNGGTFLPGAAIVNITGTTGIEVGGAITFDSSAGLKTFNGDIINNGTWHESQLVNFNFYGNITNNGSWTGSNGSAFFDGANKTIIGTSPINIPYLWITNTGTSINGTLNTGNLSLTSDITNWGSLTATTLLDGLGTVVNGSTGILTIGYQISSTAGIMAVANGNKVIYNCVGDQSIKDVQYYDLTLSGSGLKTIGSNPVSHNLEIDSGVKANLSADIGVHLLMFNNVAQPAGSYGSTSSINATTKNDTYFSGTGSVNTPDITPPTFTADRTALNTIVLTFSESVNETAGQTSAWTVAGATVTNIPGVVSGTTMTLTTTGLTSTGGTPAVTYVAASGNLLDLAGNEMLNGATSNAIDHIPPTLSIDISSSSLSTGETATVTFNFSEAPTGFNNSNIFSPNATVSNPMMYQNNPLVYTALLTPMPNISAPTNTVFVTTTWTDSSSLLNHPLAISYSPNYSVSTLVRHGGGGAFLLNSSNNTSVGSSTTPLQISTSNNQIQNQIINSNNQIQNNIITTNSQETSSADRDLMFGNNGLDVKSLQKFLNAHGSILDISGIGSPGHETIYFRHKTRAAVIAYQKAHDLIPDGIVGVKTKAVMSKL